MSLILEFTTRAAADTVLSAINAVAAAWWAEHGYTVVDESGQKELIGRNAATGADRPTAARTTTWATVEQSPDGTWYFPSLSKDARFENWRDRMPPGEDLGTERERPAAWFEGISP